MEDSLYRQIVEASPEAMPIMFISATPTFMKRSGKSF